MRRLLVLLLMMVYAGGNIFFPAGHAVCVADMYRHCAAEDPDINIADFVFEHLLNIPEMPSCFGDEDDAGEHEKPHQPLGGTISSIQVAVAASQPLQLQLSQPPAFEGDGISYPLYGQDNLPEGHLPGVFQPPGV